MRPKTNNMKITDEKAVSVNYHLTASKNNGPEELVEQTSVEKPFVFLFGFGQLLPDFEANLSGKAKGDKFDFRIGAAKGYGLVEKDYIVKVNKESFIVDGKFDDERVKLNAEIAMHDQDGNQLIGKVLEITDTDVTMDFNHPLAGHDLHFIGEVLEVRDATAEELEHGHVHGEHGHHH